MARLKKTSVYLTQREYAALRRAARLTRRSQSDLIREGVRRVAFSIPSAANQRRRVHGDEALVPTLLQSHVQGLLNAGYAPAAIARELRITEPQVRAAMAALDAMSKR